MKVLVADDLVEARRLLQAILEAEGMEVVLAEDGREALEILRSGGVDVIISDVLMPRVDGYRLCYEVRNDPRLRDIPIIIHSGTYVSESDEKLATEFGADRFVKKTGSRDAVIKALREVTTPGRKLQAGERAPADLEVLREYSELLITKLEERNADLERTKEMLTEANRQLARSEEDFRGIIEQMQDVFFRVDPNGIVRMASPSVQRYGYARSELTGQDIGLLCDRPGDRDELLGTLRRDGVITDFELAIRTKQGGTRVGSVNARVLSGEDGSLRGAEGFVRDVTDQKRALQVLREAEEKYRSIFENSVEGIFESLPSGAIILANPAIARILGYDSADDLKATVANLGSLYANPQDRQDFLTLMEQQGLAGAREIEFKRRDGTTVWTLARGRAVNGADGEILFYEGTLVDITERKRLEGQLIQAHKMEALGRLAGGIAHDFNNLLTAIIGYSALAGMALAGNEAVRGQIREVEKAGKRAAALTSQLLVFSRKQVLAPRLSCLNDIVEGVTSMLSRVIGEDVTLRSHLDQGIGQVRADAGQIEQVIMNLVVNARDAMPDGGTVEIGTRSVRFAGADDSPHPALAAGDYVLLYVTDSGIGMDGRTVSRIFEPFFTTKEVGKGTGLGLSTVYGIVHQIGGRIDVLSEPGVGTTFNIYIPVTESPPVGRAAAARPARTLTGSETVLLVEDEDAVRKLARISLEGNGYAVVDARNADEAIEACKRHLGPIDLAITDIVMPDISGPRLAEVLVTLRKGLRILYISGYMDDSVAHSRLAPGAPFLRKPFGPVTLCEKVREVLDEKRPMLEPAPLA